MIDITVDCPSLHENQKLPILDLNVWMESNTVMFEFYRKSVANRNVLNSRSAFPVSTQRCILVEEGLRRLRNCSPDLPRDRKMYFLSDFAVSLMDSGHHVGFRQQILKAVLQKYETELQNHLAGTKNLFRNKAE